MFDFLKRIFDDSFVHKENCKSSWKNVQLASGKKFRVNIFKESYPDFDLVPHKVTVEITGRSGSTVTYQYRDRGGPVQGPYNVDVDQLRAESKMLEDISAVQARDGASRINKTSDFSLTALAQ